MTRMLALIAGLSLAACSSGGGGGGGGAPCPMKLTQQGVYCAGCKCVCGTEECPIEKGLCKKCGKAPVESKICVAYKCKEHGVMHSEPCGDHGSKQCCAKVLAPILCACGEAVCPGAGCPKCKEAGGCKPKCTH